MNQILAAIGRVAVHIKPVLTSRMHIAYTNDIPHYFNV